MPVTSCTDGEVGAFCPPAGVFVGAGATEYAGRLAADFEGYRMAGTLGSVATTWVSGLSFTPNRRA